jgi:hypothetical protein
MRRLMGLTSGGLDMSYFLISHHVEIGSCVLATKFLIA